MSDTDEAESPLDEYLTEELPASLDSRTLKARIEGIEVLLVLLGGESEHGAVVLTSDQTYVIAKLLISAWLHQLYDEQVWFAALEKAATAAVASASVPEFLDQCAAVLKGDLRSLGSGRSQSSALVIIASLANSAFKLGSVPISSDWAAPEWFKTFVVVQGKCLSRLSVAAIDSKSEQTRRRLTKGVRSLESVIRAAKGAQDALLLFYAKEFSTPGGGAYSVNALAVLMELAQKMVGAEKPERTLPAELSQCAVNTYVRDILEAKTPPPSTVLAATGSLLRSCTADHFEASVRPTLDRLQKKNPDSALPAVTALLTSGGEGTVDMSPYAESLFLPPLLRQLRSAKEEIRAMAVQAFEGLANRCKNIEVLCLMSRELLSVLAGKSGALGQWYQRYCTGHGLKSIASALEAHKTTRTSEDETVIASAVTAVAAGLCPLAEREAHEETKAVFMTSLAQWAALVPTPPQDLLKLFATMSAPGSKGPTTALSAALHLLTSSKSTAAKPLAVALVGSGDGPLIKRIEEATSKPSVICQLDYMLALRLLSELATTSVCPSAVTATPWHLLSTPASGLYPIIAYEEVDSAVLISLCGFVEAAAKVSSSSTSANSAIVSSSVANALARCLIHSSKLVRDAATSAAKAVTTSSPYAGRLSLLRALRDVVTEVSNTADTATTTRGDFDDEPSRRKGFRPPPPSRLAAALCAAAGKGCDVSAETKAMANSKDIAKAWCIGFMLAHHPMIGYSLKGSIHLWHHVSDALGVSQIPPGAASELVDALLASCLSSSASLRKSSTWALVTLTTQCGEEGQQVAFDRLAPALVMEFVQPARSLLSASKQDIDLALAPAGKLYGKVVKRGGGGSAAGTAKKTASKNASRKGKDAEEVEWEEQMKRELEAKKAAADAAGGSSASTVTLDPEEKALLEMEEATRSRLLSLRNAAMSAANALEDASSMCPAFGSAAVAPALSLLLVDGILKAPLIGEPAQKCLRTLALCVDESIRQLPIAAAHISLQVTNDGTAPGGPLESVLQGLETALLGDTEDEEGTDDSMVLSPSSLALVLPLLSVIVDDPPTPSAAQTALKLVALHAGGGEEEATESSSLAAARRALLPSMLSIVLRALLRHRRVDPPADVVLAQLLAGAAPPLNNATEWPLLLGEGGLLSDETHVREGVLRALAFLAMSTEDPVTLLSSSKCSTSDALGNTYSLEPLLWIATFDSEPAVANVAKETWMEWAGEGAVPSENSICLELLPLLRHPATHIHTPAARAFAAGLAHYTERQDKAIHALLDVYKVEGGGGEVRKNTETHEVFAAAHKAQLQAMGAVDEGWMIRRGVALGIEACASGKVFPPTAKPLLQSLLTFIIDEGLADCDAIVRAAMLRAGMSLVAAYGSDGGFLAACESAVGEKPRPGEAYERGDWRREGAVVLLGAAATHLAPDDPKVVTVTQALSKALTTPSESVQRAIADSLAPLCKTAAAKAQGPALLADLVERCLSSKSTYGERKGAAYGVAAVVKGVGVAALKREGVMAKLEEACSKSSSDGTYQAKEGALFTFEALCERLGILFEPYIIVLLPLLLKCLSDGSDKVRDAAQECARSIMAKLSSHGVKLVLPAILSALGDAAWRTKQEGIRLLGSMAYCAPAQLSSCLPAIVPKLQEAFADTHPKVREAAKRALEDIGSVIRNPEVATLSGSLMAALADPRATKDALEALLACEFMHSIDAPSLALVMPVLVRGLKDRSAEAKRRAALIIGSMSGMAADSRDLAPYLDQVLPGLKATVCDPIPDVRATSAKALGALAAGMGEARLGDLLPWLHEAIKADTSSSERSGAAQALSEVLVALGSLRSQAVLSELLPLSRHPKACVREGVLWVLCFIPAAMGRSFAASLEESLPVVLNGLSDEGEGVREVALRAGQVIVSKHGRLHSDLLLPALEEGLGNDDWRIRQSSVALLGDLLYLLGNTREAGVDDTEDSNHTARAAAAIEQALGVQRRNQVLAALYLARSDSSSVVRQGAVQVWKTIVPQTPRALREILPLLLTMAVKGLASGQPERRESAGRALGELVSKLGDSVLPEVVPYLRKGLAASADEHMREGSCLGLAEVTMRASKKQVEDFIDTLVPAVLEALCDPSPGVREQAAVAFKTLHDVVGSKATEEIVPALLKQLGDHSQYVRDRAVHGLKEVLRLRGRQLLPYLVPKLTAKPITAPHARALAALVQVTAATLHMHFTSVVPALVSELADAEVRATKAGPNSDAEEAYEALQDAANAVAKYVEEVGVNWFVGEVTAQISHESAARRRWALWLASSFVKNSSADFSPQVPMLLKALILRLVDSDQSVLTSVASTMAAVNTRVGAEALVPNLGFCCAIISSVISDAKHRRVESTGSPYELPGLNIPRGLEPWLPMYQQALLYGSPEARESAAAGIGVLVDATSSTALQPFLIKITGPLIRIVGDRFPSGVKAAILHTLSLLLGKGGAALKPFVPQLQTTFVRALGDPGSAVRAQGLLALTALLNLTTRVDPLLLELATSSASPTAASDAIRLALITALDMALKSVGGTATPGALSSVTKQLSKLLVSDDTSVRSGAASAIGRTLALSPEGAVCEALEEGGVLSTQGSESSAFSHSRTVALAAVAKVSPTIAVSSFDDLLGPLLNGSLSLASEEERVAACEGLGYLTLAVVKSRGEGAESDKAVQKTAPAFAGALDDGSSDVRKAAASAVRRLAKSCPSAVRSQVLTIVPALVKALKDNNLATKLATERALVHVLEVHSRPVSLTAFVAAADVETSRFVRDYARRVLAKLPEDSGDEAS